MSNFISSFFGKLFGGGLFYPMYNSRILGQRGPIYIDIDRPYYIYNSIPEVRLVIDKLAMMFSNMVIVKEDVATGKEVVMSPEEKAFFENPNPVQSFNLFLQAFLKQKKLYGNSFIYKNEVSSLSKVPASCITVPPSSIVPILTGKLLDQTEMSGIVKNYEVTENGSKRPIETKLILWQKISDIDNPIIGKSPLHSLQLPISNIKHAYDFLNVISAESGAIGIISANNKDGMGSIPMNSEEKRQLEEAYQDTYGIGNSRNGRKKSRIHISSTPLSWEAMAYPTRELMLLEQIEANKNVIAGVYGLNVNIIGSNQTYENVKNGYIQTYQDVIFPDADEFTQHFTPFISKDKNIRYVAKYDHLRILKDEKQNLSQIVQALVQAVQARIMTKSMAQQVLANELSMQVDTSALGDNTTADNLTRLSPIVANKVLEAMKIDDVLGLVGLPPLPNGEGQVTFVSATSQPAIVAQA